MACRISFGLEDTALIDWHAAVLFGNDMDDVRAVLEFANVELLEMRMLDEQLDTALDEGYEALTRSPGCCRSPVRTTRTPPTLRGCKSTAPCSSSGSRTH